MSRLPIPRSSRRFWFAARRASKATVLLSGVGGDEMFAGYRKHVAHGWAEEYRRVPALARSGGRKDDRSRFQACAARLSKVRCAWRRRWRAAPLSVRPKPSFEIAPISTRTKSRSLYAPQARATTGYDGAAFDPASRHLAAFNKVRHADFLNQMLYLDAKIFMPTLNLTYNDKMSMASSVEVRVPFLDRHLAEFVAWNVKPEWKLKGKWRPTTKYIFREAMRGMLPNEVLRQPKAGFAAPVDYWLAHDLRPLVDDLLSESQVRSRGLFQPRIVRALRRRASPRRRRLVHANLATADPRNLDATLSRRRRARVRGQSALLDEPQPSVALRTKQRPRLN